MIASFWSTMRDLLAARQARTKAELGCGTFEWIEALVEPHRLDSHLGSLAPGEFERLTPPLWSRGDHHNRRVRETASSSGDDVSAVLDHRLVKLLASLPAGEQV